jgi:hypothetical protein
MDQNANNRFAREDRADAHPVAVATPLVRIRPDPGWRPTE